MIKSYVATIRIEMDVSDPEFLRRRIIQIPFGDFDVGFCIDDIREGNIEEDETAKPEYRKWHGCD